MIGPLPYQRLRELPDKLFDQWGAPRWAVSVAGAPAIRPAGKPLTWDFCPRPMATKQAARREQALAAKHRQWDRLFSYRDQIRIAFLRAYPEIVRNGPTLEPVVCMLEFYLQRPKNRPAEKIVVGPPDVKNLIFSVEDALSPPRRGTSLPYLWRGVWKDDSLSHTIPFRWYADVDQPPHTRITVWQMRD